MSNLRNSCVALLNLGVKGHLIGTFYWPVNRVHTENRPVIYGPFPPSLPTPLLNPLGELITCRQTNHPRPPLRHHGVPRWCHGRADYELLAGAD